MSRSKAKGTAAETATVLALRSLGFPYAERRALAGALDLGDITGVPGVCWEVKDAKTWKTPEWLRETEAERLNSRADYGILVIKAPGVGYQNAHRWLTVMEFPAAEDLWQVAGCHRQRDVFLKAVGLKRALEELVNRERHCAPTPVQVCWKERGGDGMASLMRLEDRCRQLISAGYGEIVREYAA